MDWSLRWVWNFLHQILIAISPNKGKFLEIFNCGHSLFNNIKAIHVEGTALSGIFFLLFTIQNVLR